MAKRIGSRTITVLRKAKVDRLSGATAAETEHEIKGCVILPRASSGAQSASEQNKGWVIIEGRMVVAPYGADIRAKDRVRLPDGQVMSVDGEPGEYENKKGRGKATIFYLDALTQGS